MEFHPMYYSADSDMALLDNDKIGASNLNLLNQRTNREDDSLYDRPNDKELLNIRAHKNKINYQGVQFNNSIFPENERDIMVNQIESAESEEDVEGFYLICSGSDLI